MIGDTYKQIESIQLKYKYIEDTIQTYICIYIHVFIEICSFITILFGLQR